MLPSGVKAIIDLDAWPVPPIFKYLAKLGEIETDELLQSFNMGVGMVVVVPSAHVKEVEADLKRRREKFYSIGRIERGDTGKARLVYSGALNYVSAGIAEGNYLKLKTGVLPSGPRLRLAGPLGRPLRLRLQYHH